MLRTRPSVAAVEVARKEGYQEGVAAEKKAGQSTPEQVKKIMNQMYQSLSTQLKTQASFTSKEVQTLVLSTIRVRGTAAVLAWAARWGQLLWVRLGLGGQLLGVRLGLGGGRLMGVELIGGVRVRMRVEWGGVDVRG